MKMSKLLYTVTEAAEALSISRAKVYELFNTGELESVKIGGSRRIPRQALEAFVESLRP
jgi:excisionase family DNA binding protein